MEIILWRHAEAEPGEPDLGRRLTSKGIKQSHRVAEWLHARLPETARVLVSPTDRATQTAKALASLSGRKFKTIDNLAPEAGADDVLAAVGWPDGKLPVVVVGHQPALGWVASRLLCGRQQDWSIKKGGVWWLSARDRDGEDQVVLRAMINPDLL
jgi:phosphohistidine phosphatase